MSTFAYATLTNVRDDADPQKPENAKPGVNKYVDAMAALVPAEILGLHAILLSFTTEKASNDDLKSARSSARRARWRGVSGG